MGGGAICRGISKLVGAATVAASASASISHVYAKPSGSSLALRASSCSISGLPCEEPLVRHPAPDGWELTEEWENCHYQNQHIMFDPAPTENEVDEATQELQAAFKLFPASGEDGQQVFSDWIRPRHLSYSQETMLTTECSPVYQAFQLLQTNPQVQVAVKSLACDPAVWQAVLSNEKVQELKRALEGGEAGLEAIKGHVGVRGGMLSLEFVTSMYNRIRWKYNFIRCKVSAVMGKIVEIVSSMFESADTMVFGKMYSDPFNKGVTSCMMLAVAVLVVVLIKRGSA